MGAGEMSWGDVCLGEGRRGTEDRREEQQGEGKRLRLLLYQPNNNLAVEK